MDDAAQRECVLEDMGELVAVGGVLVPKDRVRELNQTIDRLCHEEFGFPEREVFKWSPARDHWMRDNLVSERRTEFFRAVLRFAAEAGAKAHVSIEDKTRRPATRRSLPHEHDVVVLALERFNNFLTSCRTLGMVISAKPGGGHSDEIKFLEGCLETLNIGTEFVDFDRIVMNVVTAPFQNSRLLQLADLVTSCTTAMVAGHTTYSVAIFPDIVELFTEDVGRKGGVGLKLHPDFLYVNLYHWLLGDDSHILLRYGHGHSLPRKDRPYYDDPFGRRVDGENNGA